MKSVATGNELGFGRPLTRVLRRLKLRIEKMGRGKTQILQVHDKPWKVWRSKREAPQQAALVSTMAVWEKRGLCRWHHLMDSAKSQLNILRRTGWGDTRGRSCNTSLSSHVFARVHAHTHTGLTSFLSFLSPLCAFAMNHSLETRQTGLGIPSGDRSYNLWSPAADHSCSSQTLNWCLWKLLQCVCDRTV